MTTPGLVALITDAASALRREGRPQLAEALLRRRSTTPQQRPVVVVAGDTGSGKSLLVNALLRRRDLSPVGDGGVTAVPLSVVYADPARAGVLRWDDPQPVSTGIESACQLATVTGNPRGRENVQAIQVGVPCPLLERLVVVDTPGAGGLGSGHAELVLESLRCVDALVFVTDASATLSDVELSFLGRAAAVTDTIVIGLTKIDAHPDWETTRDADIAALRDQLPELRDPTVFALDTALATQALDVENLPRSAALRTDAGFTALEDALLALVIERSETRAHAALLRDLAGALADADRVLADMLDALGPDPVRREALEAERTRLTASLADDAEWQYALDADLRATARHRLDAVAAELDGLARRSDTRLTDDADRLPGELAAHLLAIASRLLDSAATQILTAVDTAIARIEGPAADPDSSLCAAARSQAAGLPAVTAYRPRFGSVPGVLDVPGFSLAGVAAATSDSLAASIRGWSEQAGRATAELVAARLAPVSAGLAAEVSRVIRAAVSDRLEQIAAILSQADEISATDPSHRDTATADLVARRRRLAKLRARAEALAASPAP